jgi:CHAT domain-containing protein
LDDKHDDKGFLVERFPVVRRVFDQPLALLLPLASVAYVLPLDSPSDAEAEVKAVHARLGSSVTHRGVVLKQADLLDLLENAPPSVLHFACHNEFTSERGSVITMEDGPLTPTDLAIAVQRKALAAVSPLVFLNACRTAAEIEGLSNMTGWATEFMKAGAGVFLGSLWAVRSSTARNFAEAFYDAFVSRRLPLGRASYEARQQIARDDGDPTWLAYSVYGDVRARVR